MSDGLQLVEPIVAAIVERCSVEALNAEVDTANLDDPAGTDETYRLPYFEDGSVLDYVPPPSAIGARVPMVGIQHGTSGLEDDQAWSATGVYTLIVCVFYASADPATLARRLRRYTRCLARVLLEGRQIGEHPWGIRVQGIDYGDVLGQKGSDLMLSWAGIVIEARHDED